ncbi:hypothetical protein PanWU01x14_003280 [Parasponia andersonii]|uniref:Uncharacterized protein n=1 Tax=Parasponia andersonii TaxID=3476 RepID=A0A2P5E5H5_PARAD|nr:hypothetical protein PanWU01x14_003280 [Parasponia andersonii]
MPLLPDETQVQRESASIIFTEEETRRLIHLHNDALVVVLKIANGQVFPILVDIGSLVDILLAYQNMNIGGAVLRPSKTSLYGFAEECVHHEGVIGLPITFGEGSAAITQIVDFQVVDQRLAYNTIISRPILNKLSTVVSTYHLILKFPIEEGVEVIEGDQTLA